MFGVEFLGVALLFLTGCIDSVFSTGDRSQDATRDFRTQVDHVGDNITKFSDCFPQKIHAATTSGKDEKSCLRTRPRCLVPSVFRKLQCVLVCGAGTIHIMAKSVPINACRVLLFIELYSVQLKSSQFQIKAESNTCNQ